MRNEHHLDLLDRLTQHLTQAEAVIDYMTVDIGENQQFSVNAETVGNMLWTAQTLLANAKQAADELAKSSRELMMGGNNE